MSLSLDPQTRLSVNVEEKAFGAFGNGAFGLFLTPKLLRTAFTAEWGVIALAPLAFFYGLSLRASLPRCGIHGTLRVRRRRRSAGSFPSATTCRTRSSPRGTGLPSRIFTFENRGYAELFRTSNADRIWRKQSEKARKAAARRSMLTICIWIAIAAIAAYAIYEDMHEWFGGVLRSLRVLD